MRERTKLKMHSLTIILILLLFLCLCASFMLRIMAKKEPIQASAEIVTDNLIMDNWGYLSNLEEEYRDENPNKTPQEIVSFLENEIAGLKQLKNSSINLMNDSTVGDSSYSIFGKDITSAELSLVLTYPAQAIIAFNASKDASNSVPNFYEGSAWLNNADAFRHAYWNALMERRISKEVWINTGTPDAPYYVMIHVDFAKEFSDAHEYGNTGIDPEMDLRNNALGRSDAVTYKELDENQLALKIVERIAYGYYWRIINEEIVDGKVIKGDLVSTDWTGLIPQYFEQIMFDTILVGEFEVCLSKVKWEIDDIYDLPSTLNGKTVAQIGSSAFANQIQVTSITLPSTITSIGAEAFSGCTSLTSINIPANVTSIGAGAFADCSSLTNITIPAGVTSVGEGAFAGCSNLNISVNTSNSNYSAQGNVLYNKAKSKIIGSGDIAANITIPNTVTEVGESAFSGNSNLQRVDIYGTPVIDDFAFYDCANLDEVYFYSYTVPEIGAGAFSDNTFTVYVPYNKQSSYYTIFSGYTNSIDSIPITVTLKKDGVAYQTIDTYYGADISGVTDPYKEGYTFNYWVDGAGNTYQNGDVWDSTVDLIVEADWTARQFHITFSGYGSENLDAKPVTYDQAIGALPVISKMGNTFNGWKDEYGVYYTADTVWQRTSNLMLTSDFSPNEYTITYNGNGGTESISTQNVEYGTVVNSLATATKTGYTFTGWNVQADGTGETISAPYTYEIANDITLYAQYTVNTYTATFDKQGGNGGLAGVEATYGEAMPTTTAPTRTGYTFGGYYSQTNGGGTQYYDEDMNSMHVWNYANAATLYAKWVANTYTVTLQVCYPGGANSSLTSQSSSDFKYINYTATESTTITIWTTHTSGDPYLVLYNENLSQLAYNDDGKGNLDSKITYTVTSGVTYVIGFRGYGSRFTKGKVYISKDITATYGSAMPSNAVPTQAGYTFEGYYTAQNGNGTKYYNSDMSSANNWNIAGATTLYANWTAHVYTVILNKQSSVLSGTDSVEVTYGSPMPSAEAPTRNNYIFQGYFAETDGAGKQYYDAQMNSINDWDVADGGTIFAYWLGNPYTVTFDKQGGSGGTSSVTARYGATMPTATAPTRTNYVLVGYFDEPNGAGSKYYDGPNMVSVKDWDKTTDTTLYAYWRGAYYTISYQNLMFMGKNAEVIWDNTTLQDAPTYYEYGKGLDLSRASAFWQTSSPYTSQLVFLGWYTDMTFTTPVPSISTSKTGTVYVYAKWRYDFNQSGRYGEYTITDADPYTETYYDDIWLGLKYNDLYQQLKTIGIKYIYVEFKLQIKEINDGYQEILIYKDTSPTSNPIWSVTDIEHYPNGVGSTAAYYIWTCAFEIDDIKDCNYLYIRYGAHGKGSDTWVTERIYMDIMYTATEDSDEDVEEFYWDYSADVDDEDCIPLKNVSDSY